MYRAKTKSGRWKSRSLPLVIGGVALLTSACSHQPDPSVASSFVFDGQSFVTKGFDSENYGALERPPPPAISPSSGQSAGAGSGWAASSETYVYRGGRDPATGRARIQL